VIPEFVWAFVTGLAGSLHCLGMCGPLVVAYSLHLHGCESGSPATSGRPWPSGMVHHIAFHAGRVLTYGSLGALAAGFVYLGDTTASLEGLRTGAVLAGGLLLVLFGLALIKILPFSFVLSAGSGSNKTVAGRLLLAGLNSSHYASKMTLGLAAGFLPCMLSWAMVIQAATTGNPMAGFLYMVCFGLGTIPMLLFAGFFASFVTLRMRLAGERLAGLSLIVMGLLLLSKGVARLV
jgi:uncharacterized protein